MGPLVATLLLVAAAGGVQRADPKVFPIGRIVENVTSASAPAQKFTIYVPASYDASRPAPILYLMDPRGRARVPAKLFQAAAERYGYILVSSHNTASDAAPQLILHAMQAMWDDSHAWFRIDDRRVYIAGFSGTARMASLIAQNRPAIAGIIGAGAGFHPDVIPASGLRFLYFGAVGTADYNYHEVDTLEHALAAHNLPHRVERFAGPHSWMPEELATQAVEWLELRAMQAGLRPRDEMLLEGWWQRDEKAALARQAAGRPLAATRRYAAMARDYHGMRRTSDVRATAARLAASRDVQAALEQRKAQSRRSREWIASAMQAIIDAYPAGEAKPRISS